MSDRVAIVGAGHVGAATAYALMLRGLFPEIVLIDADEALAVAEAADISDANALARPARIFAGSYADAASARIAVLTAGAATHGSESRLSVASRSAAIVKSCVEQLASAGFEGILVVAANPVDLMAWTAFRHSGLPSNRVIGTGTLLDSCRMRQEIANRLGVAPASIDGLVLGEHGDSEVALLSSIRVGGQTLERFTPETLDGSEIAKEVRDAGYKIISGKGFTSYGIATAAVRICEAVIRDERVVLPVSSLMTGQLGISDLYLSLPCLIGAGGIEQVLVPDMNAGETEALLGSASTIRDALTSIAPA
ncbi:MAG: L-lactate dehydrogenase [Sphingomonadales bacterium]